MSRPVIKYVSVLALVAMSAGLLFYAHGTRKIAVQDMAFCRDSSLAALFPESWLLRGNLARLVDLDTEKGVELFRRAVALQPVSMDAWLALARGQAALGRDAQAREILDLIAAPLERVSTWKWQEFLLAHETEDDDRFASCVNFVLTRLPHRIPEACFLAVQYWGGWGSVIPHLDAAGRPAFLAQLMKAREVDTALGLWEAMELAGEADDDRLRLQVCNFLLSNGRPRDAKGVWKRWNGSGGSPVFDGGFEKDFLNTAFGWRVGRQPSGVVVERSLRQPHSGSYCLHVHFRGSDNPNFYHVSQILPVEPGGRYTVKYARKSRGITTDQGVYLEAAGYQCKGLAVQGPPLVGTSPWTREQFQVEVPGDCEAMVLRVKRRESLRFDSKIAGDFWLDDVEVVKAVEASAAGRQGEQG